MFSDKMYPLISSATKHRERVNFLARRAANGTYFDSSGQFYFIKGANFGIFYLLVKIKDDDTRFFVYLVSYVNGDAIKYGLSFGKYDPARDVIDRLNDAILDFERKLRS